MNPIRIAVLFASTTLATAQDVQAALVRTADQIAHYRRVEQELRAATPPLDAAHLAARAQAIDLLHEYWTRAEFGCNTAFPGVRAPYFVDDSGRRCAVGFLLDGTGGGALTQRIAATVNHAWVADLCSDPDLVAWLSAHGLSLEEAARIQGPHNNNGPPPPPPHWTLTPRPSKDPGPSREPGRAKVPARPREGGNPAAVPAGVAAQAAAVQSGARAARGTALTELADETWMPWFAQESDRWMPARMPQRDDATRTAVDVVRAQTTARLQTALTDPDASVRAAATWALGQIGVPPAIVRPLLEDAAYEVRCAAIVALGAIDSAASRHALLQLATDPAQAPMRAFVLTALAVGERGDAAADAVAAQCLREVGDPDLLGAAASYARLRGSAELQQLALQRLGGDAPAAACAQLAAAFDVTSDATTVAGLTRMAAGRGLDARRAAAAALARTQDRLALPALLTAFELEHDAAARAELLLAIGEHGGDAARAFLLEQVASGPKVLRGWAALALGVFGRDRADAGIVQAVHDGLAAERNQSALGEWILALGLLRDVAGRDLLEACYRAGDSLARAAVVNAYGLCGDGTLLPRVAEILRTDHCPFVRSTAAAVLGRSGDIRAVAMLAARLADQDAVEVRQAIAMALGATADRSAVPHLVGLAEGTSTPVRAAALRGLGRLFASGSPQRFCRLGWRADERSVPDTVRWVAGMDR